MHRYQQPSSHQGLFAFYSIFKKSNRRCFLPLAAVLLDLRETVKMCQSWRIQAHTACVWGPSHKTDVYCFTRDDLLHALFQLCDSVGREVTTLKPGQNVLLQKWGGCVPLHSWDGLWFWQVSEFRKVRDEAITTNVEKMWLCESWVLCVLWACLSWKLHLGEFADSHGQREGLSTEAIR